MREYSESYELMKLTLYSYTGKEIAEINADNSSARYYAEKLPTFYWAPVRPDKVFDTAEAFQFYYPGGLTEEQKKESHFLFQIEPVSDVLQELVSNIGIDEFFEMEYDFDSLSAIFKKLNGSELKPFINEHSIKTIPTSLFIVYSYKTFKTETPDGTEYDEKLSIIGILDRRFNLTKVENIRV
jgi:hypothetical protein